MRPAPSPVPGRATVAPPGRDNVPGVLPRAGEIPIHSPAR
jgi:hypothetical protein